MLATCHKTLQHQGDFGIRTDSREVNTGPGRRSDGETWEEVKILQDERTGRGDTGGLAPWRSLDRRAPYARDFAGAACIRRRSRQRCLLPQLTAAAAASGSDGSQRAASIFSATCGVTQAFQISGCSFRKCLAPSSPVAWLSVIQAISLLTVSLVHERLLR